MHYFTNNSVSANMSSAARTEETQRLSHMSRTEVVRLIVGGLGVAVCVVLVIGAVIAVGLYTTQANRILILTVVAVSAAAILLLCYIKPLNPSCLKQRTEVESSDDPPAYADVIKMEIPPPPYYMVVRENLYTPTPSVNYNGAGFYLPETPATKHSEAVGRTPGNTLYFTSWLVGSSVSPTLVRPGNGSPVIISAGNPDVIRSLDSPDVTRSMGGHFSVRPLVTPCLIKSPSNPSLNICTAGPSLCKSPSTPALGKLFSGVSLASSGGDSSFSKSTSTSAFDKLYTSSSLAASMSNFPFSKSPSSPALKLLDKASENSSQYICKGVPNPLCLRKSPSTPALSKLVIKPAGSPSVKTSSCSPCVDNLPNSSPGSPSGRSRNVVVFAPYGRPFFGNLTSSAFNTLPGSRSVRPPSNRLPDSPCISEPVESPIVNRTSSNISLNNLPGSPADSRSYDSLSVSRSHELLSVRSLDSPSINALPSSSCTVNSNSPAVIRSLSSPLVRQTGAVSVRKELQERDHSYGGMERKGRAGQCNTEVVLNVAALTLPQDQTCHTDGPLVEFHVF